MKTQTRPLEPDRSPVYGHRFATREEASVRAQAPGVRAASLNDEPGVRLATSLHVRRVGKMPRRARSVTTFAVLMLWAATVAGQSYMPGQTYAGAGGLIEMVAGNTPIIITVPHDGTIAPAGWPVRTAGYCVGEDFVSGGRDKNTWLMTLEVMKRFTAVTGKHVWVVRNKVSRSYFDANRSYPCATGGYAQHVYQQYHDFIAAAIARVSGRGFLVDFHGHGHDAQRLELGYLLEGNRLYAPEAAGPDSSIRAFAATHPGSFTTLLRDLGTRFTVKGYHAQPSVQDWTPEPGEGYFDGGFTTLTYGCPSESDRVCAVQMEHPSTWQKSGNHAAYAVAWVDVMIPYLKQFGIAP
jgi:N-formylglutamate amidohydrolase